MTLVIEPLAEADIGDAALWYEQQAPGLGLEFMRTVDASLAEIARGPLRFPDVYRGARRALLRRFPYAVMFVVCEQSVHVLACQHQRRDPVSWQPRIPG